MTRSLEVEGCSAKFGPHMYHRVERCRICGNSHLESLLSLGNQAFTGIFPKANEPDIPVAPLELVKCSECHLVQLAHSFDPHQLYGETYGYRSGLNQSMVRHLQQKVGIIVSEYGVSKGDFVLDIGSNDSTLLRSYPEVGLIRAGIDPSGYKFRQYYPPNVTLIPDFFSKKRVQEYFPGRQAKVVTSIAMFYDLEQPQEFMAEVRSLLAEDGVWVFEQSYMPTMLEQNAYDTICHEHLEYYALGQIVWMVKKVGLKILDVEFNDVNGGSFSVTVSRDDSPYPACDSKVAAILERERLLGLHTLRPFQEFAARVEQHKVDFVEAIENINSRGLKVFGYGASTKGNVILQWAGVTPAQIPFIAEVNPDKFGCITPGTRIPIISEIEANRLEPDFYLVLPWHFRAGILKREQAVMEAGTRFLFPLPKLEAVDLEGLVAVEAAFPWRRLGIKELKPEHTRAT